MVISISTVLMMIEDFHEMPGLCRFKLLVRVNERCVEIYFHVSKLITYWDLEVKIGSLASEQII